MEATSTGHGLDRSRPRGLPVACCDRAHGTLPRVMLLDLDDTILATSEAECLSWLGLCERFNARLGGHAPETVYRSIKEYRDWYESDPDRP